MQKTILFLSFFYSLNSVAMTIAYGETNELIKSDIQEIIEQAEKLGINPSLQFHKIRSWRNGPQDDLRITKYAIFTFNPHQSDEYYETHFVLQCNTRKEKSWACKKQQETNIRFDLKKEKNIRIQSKYETQKKHII
jgi:hypothetical protein